MASATRASEAPEGTAAAPKAAAAALAANEDPVRRLREHETPQACARRDCLEIARLGSEHCPLHETSQAAIDRVST